MTSNVVEDIQELLDRITSLFDKHTIIVDIRVRKQAMSPKFCFWIVLDQCCRAIVCLCCIDSHGILLVPRVIFESRGTECRRRTSKTKKDSDST